MARRAECEDVAGCEGEAGGEAKREGGRGERREGGQSAGRSIVDVVEIVIVGSDSGGGGCAGCGRAVMVADSAGAVEMKAWVCRGFVQQV